MVVINSNRLTGGIVRDSIRSLSPSDSLYMAKNAVLSSKKHKSFGLVNESANKLVATTGSDVVGTAYNEERNMSLIFKKDDSIWMFEHDKEEDGAFEIFNAKEFGCTFNFKDCEWLKHNIQFKTMQPCSELYVYFAANWEYYKVNIDLMLDPKRKQGLINELNCDTKCGLKDNCEYFKVSKLGCSPKVNATFHENGGSGGNLKAGVYMFVPRLVHTDGGETNWFNFSTTVNVGSEHNVAGEETSGYVQVNISGLDCKYAKLELAVIENIGGVITAKLLNTFNYGSSSYTYKYNGNDGMPIDIRDVLVKSHTFLQGKYLQQKDGRMLYYGIKSRKNPALQKYANNINTDVAVYRIPYNDVKKFDIKGFMGGETYAFSIVWNYIDGSHSKAFHIPAQGGSGSGGGSSQGLGAGYQPPSGVQNAAEIDNATRITRTRDPKPDSFASPQNDHFDNIVEDIMNSMDTNNAHICQEIKLWQEYLSCGANCEGSTFDATAYDRCVDDMGKGEEIFAKWQDLLSYYTLDKSEVEYSSDFIYDGGKLVKESILKRERKVRTKRKYILNKGAYNDYEYDGGVSKFVSPIKGSYFASNLFDNLGVNETEVNIETIGYTPTSVSEELNVLYPCQTDCEGNFLYGDLASKRVRHHRFPLYPHFYSKSVGVPHGTFFPDADIEGDLYINILGVRFSNIEIPDEDELPMPLCPNNPYTIGMVEVTEANRSILMKGVASGTFKINSGGKIFDHPRYAANSKETVSFYHDDQGSRLSTLGDGNSHTIYSLDGQALRPSLSADSIVQEMILGGKGERYGLYFKGKQPEDALRGRRVDSLGAVQAINFSDILSTGIRSSSLDFIKYVKGNTTDSPGSSGYSPLMNKSGQPCYWVGSDLPQITDGSFTGDVLDHNVPINDAQLQYVSVRRNLDNQYGNLENLSYIPLLYAGKNNFESGIIEGPVGDTYTGVYSFVKTGYVSDKVGSCASEEERFNIPAMFPPGIKSKRRCICDSPDDLIHQQSGNFVWTELPEEGDAADPKNWAGTHTTITDITRAYNDSVNQIPTSDFYLPGTTTTNISYVGQFRACPWRREKSDLLEKQWFPEIKTPEFRFVAQQTIDNDGIGWEDSFLNQYHREIIQPSLWQRLLKAIVRTLLTLIFPIWGLDNLFDITNGGVEIVGNIAEFPMMVIIWYLMLQVLFTNDRLDKMLNIPECKSDEKGGFKENYNRGLFFNFSGYNIDYSVMANLYTYEGVPDPYYTCDCEDTTNNEIYVSDKQIPGSIFDSYTHIRPLSKIEIPSSFGRLTNLFIAGGELYAHTTDAIIPLRRNRTAIPTDVGDIIIGRTGFLVDPEGSITEGIPEGYSGLRNHNDHIDTQYGYIFIDSDADIIYSFHGSKGLSAISMIGMYNFFKEKLEFCTTSECSNERAVNSTYYAMGVDPRHNRLLVTKSDGEYSFTISYSFETEKWISFHDYIPRDYIWDRKNMYTLNEEGIWKHNIEGKYQTFYGKKYPFIIEVNANSASSQGRLDSFTFNSLQLNTEATKYLGDGKCLEDVDVTFNKIAVWNSTQGTGTKDIEILTDNENRNNSAINLIKDNNSIRFHKNGRLWFVNELHDYVKSRELPLLTCKECEPFEEVVEESFDIKNIKKQDFKNRVLNDKYLTYKLIFDLDTETELKVIYINTKGTPRDV